VPSTWCHPHGVPVGRDSTVDARNIVEIVIFTERTGSRPAAWQARSLRKHLGYMPVCTFGREWRLPPGLLRCRIPIGLLIHAPVLPPEVPSSGTQQQRRGHKPEM
jgi:hypothetical protein